MRPSPPQALRRAHRRRRIAALVLVLVPLGVVGYAVAGRYLPGDVKTGSAAAHGATILRYDVRSRFVKRTLPQVAAIPAAGGQRPPLLVFLHGRGPDGQESNSTSAFYAGLEALGDRAPVVVFPSGGEASYFHKRAGGDWGRYILDEVIPRAVARLGADPRRVAIGGISMGGFGAFAVARLRPAAFCAVGGHSAALWQTGGETPAGAFDDGQDFARNDLIALARARGRAPWGRAKLWLDGGTEDPFRGAGETFAAALKIPMRHWNGAHEGAYWSAHVGRYLRFYADALARC